MTVYEKSNSPYLQIDFQVNGVRYAFSSRTDSEAEARRIETRAKKEAQRLASPSEAARDCTFDQAAYLYWDLQGQATRQTETLKSRLRRVVLMVGEDTLCSSIDLEKILVYRRDLRKGLPGIARDNRGRKPTKKGAYAPKHVNNHLALVFTVLFHAERVLGTRWPKLPRSGDRDMEDAKIMEPVQPRKRYLKIDEEKRLEAVSEPDLLDMWKLDLEIAFREGNLCEARWDDIDWDELTISASIKAKGRSPRIHTVHLSDEALAILRRRKAAARSDFIFTLPAKRRYWRKGVLQNVGDPVPASSVQFRRRFKTACNEAGIKDLVAHDLRRTAGRRMWIAKDILAARILLGHSDIKTTVDYIGAEPGDLVGFHAARPRPH